MKVEIIKNFIIHFINRDRQANQLKKLLLL